MSLLNNRKMLPEKIRAMRQMSELLQSEEIVLNCIEAIINDFYERAVILKEELINEEWLEEKLMQIIGDTTVQIRKVENQLWIEVVLCNKRLSISKSKNVIAFLERWLPAHLGYDVTCQKDIVLYDNRVCIWQDDETIVMREVRQ